MIEIQIAAIWIALGAGGSGFALAYFDTEYPGNFRENLGFSVMLGVIWGPIALLIAFLMSGFGQHGWRLWRK